MSHLSAIYNYRAVHAGLAISGQPAEAQIAALPGEAELLEFFDAMEKHRDKKILAHCAANKRVTAFLGLYFVIKQGQAAEQAFALMRQVWAPDPLWSSFIADMLRKHAGPPLALPT